MAVGSFWRAAEEAALSLRNKHALALAGVDDAFEFHAIVGCIYEGR